ncbi:hypothetical protein AYO20_08283 [Fonsecaea nubica]|uniref:Alpha/beta hydrolase fold-3 domain-containing protein n=1 Tax=Fonsecaea nubica TaxID=856822 RepID=A0A178CN32_9EURO|nr:hypothetical protein AYO20_08283 [Fonsecaea nubica]OAL31228.1 hypothetical protein AYO20_08283 [Fonsecaea nubica]
MPSPQSEAIKIVFGDIGKILSQGNLPLDITRSVVERAHTLASESTDVTYDEVDCPGSETPALWCKPIGASGKHIVLYFHGGGYTSGNPHMYRKLAGHLGKAIGFQVLVTDFRKAPEAPFPAQHEDSTATYQWLLQKGYLPENIVLAGDSAGGNLAITTALRLKKDGKKLPGAVVTFSPWVDMELNGKTFETNSGTDVIITRAASAMAVAAWLQQASPKDPLANPLYADFAGYPPLFISAGTHESLLDDSVRLAEVAERAGVHVFFEQVEGLQHVHEFMAGKAPEVDETFAKVRKFLETELKL